MIKPRVVHQDHNVVLAQRSGVSAAVWRGQPSVRYLPMLEDCIGELYRADEQRVAVVTIIETESQSPSPETRKAFALSLKGCEPMIACVAQPLMVDGLKGTAFRSILSTMNLISRFKPPLRVTASMREAAHFLRLHRGDLPESEVLAAWLESLRQT